MLTKEQKISEKNAQELTKARINQGITQKDLSERAGISTALLCYIERGERTLTPEVATALQEAFRSIVEERAAIRAAAYDAVIKAMEHPHLRRMREEGGFEA